MKHNKAPACSKMCAVVVAVGCMISVFSPMLFAQRAPVSAGGKAVGKTGSVQFTVGQIDYTTSTGSGGAASHGVQQPHETYTITGVAGRGVSLTGSVFPNPTSGVFTLRVEDAQGKGLRYMLTDVAGKLVAGEDIQDIETMIDMRSSTNGTYMVHVLDDHNQPISFTITKSNQP